MKAVWLLALLVGFHMTTVISATLGVNLGVNLSGKSSDKANKGDNKNGESAQFKASDPKNQDQGKQPKTQQSGQQAAVKPSSEVKSDKKDDLGKNEGTSGAAGALRAGENDNSPNKENAGKSSGKGTSGAAGALRAGENDNSPNKENAGKSSGKGTSGAAGALRAGENDNSPNKENAGKSSGKGTSGAAGALRAGENDNSPNKENAGKSSGKGTSGAAGALRAGKNDNSPNKENAGKSSGKGTSGAAGALRAGENDNSPNKENAGKSSGKGTSGAAGALRAGKNDNSPNKENAGKSSGKGTSGAAGALRAGKNDNSPNKENAGKSSGKGTSGAAGALRAGKNDNSPNKENAGKSSGKGTSGAAGALMAGKNDNSPNKENAGKSSGKGTSGAAGALRAGKNDNSPNKENAGKSSGKGTSGAAGALRAGKNDNSPNKENAGKSSGKGTSGAAGALRAGKNDNSPNKENAGKSSGKGTSGAAGALRAGKNDNSPNKENAGKSSGKGTSGAAGALRAGENDNSPNKENAGKSSGKGTSGAAGALRAGENDNSPNKENAGKSSGKGTSGAAGALRAGKNDNSPNKENAGKSSGKGTSGAAGALRAGKNDNSPNKENAGKSSGKGTSGAAGALRAGKNDNSPNKENAGKSSGKGTSGAAGALRASKNDNSPNKENAGKSSGKGTSGAAGALRAGKNDNSPNKENAGKSSGKGTSGAAGALRAGKNDNSPNKENAGKSSGKGTSGAAGALRAGKNDNSPNKENAGKSSGKGTSGAAGALRAGKNDNSPNKENAGKSSGKGTSGAAGALRAGKNDNSPNKENAGKSSGKGTSGAAGALRAGKNDNSPNKENTGRTSGKGTSGVAGALRAGKNDNSPNKENTGRSSGQGLKSKGSKGRSGKQTKILPGLVDLNDKLQDLLFNKKNSKSKSKDKSKNGFKDRSKSKEVSKGPECEDVKIESFELADVTLPFGRKVVSMTLGNLLSKALCTLGTSFGFDSNKVFVKAGCRGIFRVCYEKEEKASASSEKPKCKRPFQDRYGYCVVIESDAERTYIDAAAKCAELGGRLVNLVDASYSAAGFKGCGEVKGQTFYVGSSNINENQVEVFAAKFKIDKSTCKKALKRFEPKATVQDLNHQSILSSQCAVLDFKETNSFIFGDCNVKRGYICEQISEDVEKEDESAVQFTEWISASKPDNDGEDENLADIVKAYDKGKLPNLKSPLCKKPLAMECRAVGTNNLYSKSNTNGLKLDKACEKDSIKCSNKKQKTGTTCPDFEVRFKCPNEILKDCAVDSVRRECAKKNRECVMKAFGAVCVKKARERTGREVIGRGACTVNSITYQLSECSSRGDPHYMTFDGLSYDFQGSCDYLLASTTDDYIATSDFPAFSLTSSNEKRNPKDRVSYTKGFSLKINGRTYTAKDGEFLVDNMARSIVSFEDSEIKVIPQLKGSTTYLTITTDFCLTVTWDFRDTLTVTIPSAYNGHTFGLCGNSDDNPDNDLVLPGSDKIVSPDVFGRYHMVGATSNDCVDVATIPAPCPADKRKIFNDKKFCGLFDPENQSPLIAEVSSSKEQECKRKNLKVLKQRKEDCINDHCLVSTVTEDTRCSMIESFMADIRTQLLIDSADFDNAWRKYAGCESSPEIKCGGKPNTEYSTSYFIHCQNTCNNREKSSDCDDYEIGQGCVCKEGFYLDSKLNCVPASECDSSCRYTTSGGTTFNLKDGETAVIEPCRTIVTCKNGDPEETDLDPCSENAICRNNGKTCVCKEGFTGNGIICTSDVNCKKGYTPVGDKCLKLFTIKAPWQEAAIICGADGAELVRYDNEKDNGVVQFTKKLNDVFIQDTATSRAIKCRPKSTCNVPKGQSCLSVRTKDPKFEKACAGKVTISENRQKITVGADCKAVDFIIETADSKKCSGHADPIKFWIGGNIAVISLEKRNILSHCQLKPPSMIDSSSLDKQYGCFQALSGDKFVVTVNPDCEAKQYFICEYDKTKQNTYDPNDYKVIPQKVTQQEAIDICAKEKRPLASITTLAQLNAAKTIVAAARDNCWINLKYSKPDNDYIWGTGEKLSATISNFKEKPVADFRSKQLYCVGLNRKTGQQFTSECDEKLFALCGPATPDNPFVYTQYFPFIGMNSLEELKLKQQAEGKQDYVCSEPTDIECSAKATSGTLKGTWVTDKNQQGSIMSCKKGLIKCTDNQGLDCSTFRARFLCPKVDNICQALEEIDANPCSGGQVCIPTKNHYRCQCASGTAYNDVTKSCISFCGECSAWGDPHYTTYRNKKYNYFGNCSYLFSGVREDDEMKNSPRFNVYTTNKECGDKGATCIHRITVELLDIPTVMGEEEVKVNYNFTYVAGAKSYLLNDVPVSQTDYVKGNSFTVVKKDDTFDLISSAAGVRVTLVGIRLVVSPSERYSGHLDGLCFDCASDQLRLRDGSVVNVDERDGNLNDKQISAVADDWLVPDSYLNIAQCKLPAPVIVDSCTAAKKAELSKPTKCGIFKDESSVFNECIVKLKVDRQMLVDTCLIDACLENNPEEAVCTSLKSLAQKCLKKKIPVSWRTKDLCPMDCGSKIYRVNAACEPTCGRSVVAQESCRDTPREGCVCADKLMKQGDACVPASQCGCSLSLDDTVPQWSLSPGEQVIVSSCSQIATCTVDDAGTSMLIYSPYNLPLNSYCSNDLPHKVLCLEGYNKGPNGECIRDPVKCVKGYVKINNKCAKISDQPKPWRGAIQACNEEDGTLVKVDSDESERSIKKLLQDKKFSEVYLACRIIGSRSGRSVQFRDSLNDAEKGKIEWNNFDCSDYFRNKITLAPNIPTASVPVEGTSFAVVAKLDKGNIVYLAVSPDTLANFICIERKTSDEDTKWYGPCDTDSNMEDDGDHETRYEMIMNPNCLVCPVPMDVLCEESETSPSGGTVNGTCQLGSDGEYYTCDEGSSCINKAVLTKCARDADECETGRHDCPINSQCVNTVGGYACKCNEDTPFMVNGKCLGATTCVMSGPPTPTDYIYNILGFSGIPGSYSYNCQYKLAYMCSQGNYNPSSGLPFISFYDLSTRESDVLQPYLSGTIYNPKTEVTKSWAVTPESLASGKVYISRNEGRLVLTDLSYTDKSISTRFQYIATGQLAITNEDGYFKALISFSPIRVQISFSEVYNDKICGLCKAVPSSSNRKIVLSAEDLASISVSSTRCAERVTQPVPEPENSETQPAGSPPPASTEGLPPVPPSEVDESVTDGEIIPEESTSEGSGIVGATTRPPPAAGSPPPALTGGLPPGTPPEVDESVTDGEIIPEESTSEGSGIVGATTLPPPAAGSPPPALTGGLPPGTPPEVDESVTEGDIISEESTSEGSGIVGATTRPPPPQTTQEDIPIEKVFTPGDTTKASLPTLPFETFPPPVEVSSTTSTLPGLPSELTTLSLGEPKPSEVPTVPTDPALSECNNDALLVCAALKYLCAASEENCLKALCNGYQTVCKYLITESLSNCGDADALKNFTMNENCDLTCEENMEFKYTQKSVQPTCAEPWLSTSVSESSEGDKGFACICSQGFVLSGTKCVRESDCGCVMPDGTYKSVGSRWRSPDCNEEFTCLGNNEVSNRDSPCGENTRCDVTERGPTCVCEEGLYGNPNMPVGCKEGVVSPDNSKTCYTYVLSNELEETRCDCNMGYVSDCAQCVDVDECREGIHSCDLSIFKCENLIGGYKCVCNAGYTSKNGQCVDFNECANDTKICGENSYCRNTEGSYECTCCAGYYWCEEEHFCKRDTLGFPDLPVDARCCAVCNDVRCLVDDALASKYCYVEEGKKTQYPSYKRLYQEQCVRAKPLLNKNVFKGDCPADAPPADQGSGGQPTPPVPKSCEDESLCASLPPPPPVLALGKVCGPSNSETPKTYPSYCDMVKDICKTAGGPTSLPTESSIKAAPGECPSGNGPPPKEQPPSEPIFLQWSLFSHCVLNNPDRNCGVGTQYRNRQVVPYDDFRPVREVKQYEVLDSRPCFVPCTDAVPGSLESECPELSFCSSVDPVCGSLGRGAAQVYQSECVLNITACSAQKEPKKLYSGPCDAEDGSLYSRSCEESGPLQVSVKYDVEEDGLHCIGQPVTIGTCGDLQCNGASTTCCRAAEYEHIQVSVQCFDLNTKASVSQGKHVYISATQCKCQESYPLLPIDK